jgi:uncharacterized membrane protein
MNDPRLPRFVYMMVLLIGIYQAVRYYPQLPARMASHFGISGAPNGWQSKQAFFTVTGFAVALTFFVSFLLPIFLRTLPSSAINLPNKEYWLATEQRPGTFQFISAQMGWFGCSVLFLLLYAISQAIRVNLVPGMQFAARGMWFMLTGFLFFVILWAAHFVTHFARMPATAAAE